MKELNQQEIQAISGAANVNAAFITSLLGAVTGAGLGALAGGTTASIVGFLAGGIIGGIKGYNAADDSYPRSSEQLAGDDLIIPNKHLHFSALE